MGAFLDRVGNAGGKVLWLDYVEYAGRLLAGGEVPWLDSAACVAWARKAQGLLASDVVTLPIERVVGAWLASHPALGEAMRARSRAVFPIKTLLADEALRSHLTGLLAALRGSLGSTDLALVAPSPRAWVASAYRQAHGTTVDAGDDEADSASLYIADFLRAFGDCALQILLLVEDEASEPASADGIACYQSVLNVAGHYRWDVGLKAPAGRYQGDHPGLDFVIGPRPVPARAFGQLVDPAFWSGAAPPPSNAGTFRYATVPANAGPEQVLERIPLLR